MTFSHCTDQRYKQMLKQPCRENGHTSIVINDIIQQRLRLRSITHIRFGYHSLKKQRRINQAQTKLFCPKSFFPIPFLSLNSFVFVPRLVKKESGLARTLDQIMFSILVPKDLGKSSKMCQQFSANLEIDHMHSRFKISYRKQNLKQEYPVVLFSSFQMSFTASTIVDILYFHLKRLKGTEE